MATIYPQAGDNLQTVMRRLIEAAGDPRLVVYRPGDGPMGAIDVPDDVADGYDPSEARDYGEQVREHWQAQTDLYDSTRIIPGPDEPTLEDTRHLKTNVVRGNVGDEGVGPYLYDYQSHIGATEAAVLNPQADKGPLLTQSNDDDAGPGAPRRSTRKATKKAAPKATETTQE